MEWHAAIAMIRPHIVRVSTPGGSGTGFLVSRSSVGPMVAVATAAHVVQEAGRWEQPIRIEHHESGETLLLHHHEHVIFVEHDDDTAAIFMNASNLSLPKDVLGLITEGKVKKVGVELGWVGFPAVSPRSLCFFSGRVSARMRADKTYLVDGVAINGVSGGPAFTCSKASVEVVGVVPAYIANRATGETLPGVSVVQDVHQLQLVAKKLQTLDEALKKKSEEETAAAQNSAAESSANEGPGEGEALEGDGA